MDLRIDVVVHSATKYFGGYSDVIAGAVVSSAAAPRHSSFFAEVLRYNNDRAGIHIHTWPDASEGTHLLWVDG